MYKYQSLNWRPKAERKQKRHVSSESSSYKYESLNWRPKAEREKEASEIGSRNWHKLSPGTEGTALGGLMTAGVICLNVTLAIMAIFCTVDDKTITETAIVLHLPAPIFLGAKNLVHQEIAAIKHHYSTIASSKFNWKKQVSNGSVAADNSNLSKTEKVDTIASANIEQSQTFANSINSQSSNNVVPTEIASVVRSIQDSSIQGSAQSSIHSPVQTNIAQSQAEISDTNATLTKVQSGKDSKKDALAFNPAEHRITAANLLVKVSNDASLHFDKAGLLVLKTGDAVVDTGKPFLIKAGDARVLLKNKSTVLVSMRDGTLKIRNLQETHAYTAQVFFGDHNFPLCAGQELVAAQSFDRLGLAVSSDNVQRRQIRTFDLEDGTNIMCSEYNAVNVIKTTPVLKQLMLASSSKEESKTSWKIMKMAAAIATVMRAHGEYAPVSNSKGTEIASTEISNNRSSTQ